MFHYGLMAMPDIGIKNTKEKEDFLRAAWKLDETINIDNYADTVNALDSTGFKEYYNLIGAFAKKYKIANWQDYNEYEPVLIEHLNEELGRHEKTEEKLELINSFHDEELCSETFPSASKIRVLYDILDDCFVLGNKENGINRILRTFNENDKTAFITKIQSDDKLLASFIKKVNGGEKDEMLATIGEIFISSGFIKDRKTVLLDNKKTDTLTASLNKGKIYIKMESLAESTNLVPGGMGDYPNISRRTVTVSPFDIVRMNYDGRHIRVPALLLLNSWSNSAATPEGIFYNYYKEDVDWLRLSDAARDTYFAEFVMHYLPSGFIEALGNPIQLVITGIITVGLAIATGGASIAAELEVAMAAAGIALSAASTIGSIRGVLTADEMRQAAQTTHEVKKTAKFMAGCIAQLSLSVVDIILTVAGYFKGKEAQRHKEIQAKVGYKDGWNEKRVLNAIQQAKYEGKVILPEEYLTESYINKHIREFKVDGIAYLVPKDILDGYGRKIIGRPDGQFVMRRSELNKVLKQANGDISKLEKILGIDKGKWKGKTIIMIEISDVEVINLRMPTGFETGANLQWMPGGKLPSDMNEAICDRIIIGNYKETELWK